MVEKGRSGISSFSIILSMVVLALIGVAVMPLLNIQYSPTKQNEEIEIYYTWNDASPRVIEQDVTSKIEGIVSSIEGIKGVRSCSNAGDGWVIGTLKDGARMEVVRLELASAIRSLYGSLPREVSYPIISGNKSGINREPILTYTLNASIPPSEILRFAEDNILTEISRVGGVGSVEFNGATPYYLEIEYDANAIKTFGINIDDIANSVNAALGDKEVLGDTYMLNRDGEKRSMTIKFGADYGFKNMLDIPIKQVGERIIFLRDIATIQYKESLPYSYFRVNGLNTININIYAEEGVNTVNVAKAVKDKMTELEAGYGNEFATKIVFDTSEHINKELNKIYIRTILSLFILLGFVFAVNRNWRYLIVIFTTLVANILVAFIFYALFKVEINIYSLAAITVSLGMIIDTSIIMIDHYSRYADRKVFLAILGALLTTVCSMVIVFFLPNEQREKLIDFSLVMIINLVVSLFISLIFIPAIIDKYPVMRRRKKRKLSLLKIRRIRRFDAVYGRFISFCRRRRWVVITAFILLFGFPLNLLPKEIKNSKGEVDKERFFAKIYNQTIGGSWYQNTGKEFIEPVFGGFIRPFIEGIKGTSAYRSPERTTLRIYAAMPEGCNVQQLNDVMVNMENYLNKFSEIESFQTTISSYDNGEIVVYFKDGVDKTNFPEILKSKTIEKAINFGGATWSIQGRDPNGFSNNVTFGYKPYCIQMKGYNYDKLYGFAQQLATELKKNTRIKEIDIYGNSYLLKAEYFIDYDAEILAQQDVSPIRYYKALQDELFQSEVATIYHNHNFASVKLKSSNADAFDAWHVDNDVVNIGDKSVKLSDIGSIDKRNVERDIVKKDQEYILNVAFDFIGSSTLADKIVEQEVERLKYTLPVGFNADRREFSWWDSDNTKQYLLLLLIVVIIYFICAILFESLLQPLVIISLIPISFIGVFMTFYLTKSPFDQGGFASMVLLCGLVVNAGIYLINEYNQVSRQKNRYGLTIYLKAFNRKIVPISLTVMSTVLGLVPFLISGPKEVFWFSFAVGAMGGLLFSFLAIVIAIPAFLKLR